MSLNKPVRYNAIFLAIFLATGISCNSQINYPDGGYEYTNSVTEKDTLFYRYALKKDLSEKEIFQLKYEYLFFRPFNESNLSIKPFPKETFRLTWSSSRTEAFIITFDEDELIIKKGDPSSLYDYDSTVLTQNEKFHRSVFNRFPLPLNSSEFSGKRKKYLDSLIKVYPELLDLNYYHKLFEKSLVINKKNFEFETKIIKLKLGQFRSVINEINELGYWSLPYRIECIEPMADGYGYTLEANTFKKYNIVGASACPTDSTNFPKICQKIIELAHMENEINLDGEWKAIPVE